MPRRVLPLTDAAIRAARPQSTLRKLFDGGGLHLAITPSGAKTWRLKYRYAGREGLLVLGPWPSITLRTARRLRDEARELLARGIDPAEARRAERRRRSDADTFEAVAREWIEKRLAARTESHRVRTVRRLERYVFPRIGSESVTTITAAGVLECVRPIEAQGKHETAHRVLQIVGQVMRYAIATGRRTDSPVPALRGALAPAKPKHMAAPADDAARVGAILRVLHNGYGGSPEVAAALKLLPHVFVRPGELRTMRWQDIDFDAGEWRFVASKTRQPHVVPLSRQSVTILRELESLTRHRGPYVFPSQRSTTRPMSDMTIGAAYRRLGFDTRTDITPHGWRSIARTMLHERLGFAPEVIEHQLAHAVPDALGRAYNRTKFLDVRRAMMQRWSDYLDALRDGAGVVPLRRRAKVVV